MRVDIGTGTKELTKAKKIRGEIDIQRGEGEGCNLHDDGFAWDPKHCCYYWRFKWILALITRKRRRSENNFLFNMPFDISQTLVIHPLP